MQTTLLGLAIAFIIALLAALIGPYFIDWNQFRPQFEAEIAINTLLRRIPSLRLDDAENPEWRPTFVLRGLKRLPASW